MRELIRQIRVALEADLYYLALFVSFALPDICGALDSADGIATRARYKRWYDKYMGQPGYSRFMTADDCYHWRCSLLHQGSSKHPQGRYERFLFFELPLAHGKIMHMVGFNDALYIDVRSFCEDMVTSVEEWLEEVENTNQYRKNYDSFIRRYPNGIPGHGTIPMIG